MGSTGMLQADICKLHTLCAQRTTLVAWHACLHDCTDSTAQLTPETLQVPNRPPTLYHKFITALLLHSCTAHCFYSCSVVWCDIFVVVNSVSPSRLQTQVRDIHCFAKTTPCTSGGRWPLKALVDRRQITDASAYADHPG
jgi:hypothetical protein